MQNTVHIPREQMLSAPQDAEHQRPKVFSGDILEIWKAGVKKDEAE